MADLPNPLVCFDVPSEIAHEVRGLAGPAARVTALIAYFEGQEGKRYVREPSESHPDQPNSIKAHLDMSNKSDIIVEAQPASGSREAGPEEQSPNPSGQETVNGEMIDGLEAPPPEAALSTSHTTHPAVASHEQNQQAESGLSVATPGVHHEQSTSPLQNMLGGQWLLPVRAVRHVVTFPLRDLLGGEEISRVVPALGDVLRAPRADTTDAREEHVRRVAETFAPFVTAAAHYIHHHLHANSPRDKHLGLDNSDLVVTTTTNENPQVVLVFTQKLANELKHRVKLQLTAEDRLVICPDSVGTS